MSSIVGRVLGYTPGVIAKSAQGIERAGVDFREDAEERKDRAPLAGIARGRRE